MFDTMLIYLIAEYDAKSGLGLKEYLDFIEDEGVQPIMAVWSGSYFAEIFYCGASPYSLNLF